VQGTDRSVDLFAIARAAQQGDGLPEDLRGPLAGGVRRDDPGRGLSVRSHVCEVEVDPDTGLVEIVRYTAVDDVGRAVNPLILHGQTHGAIVQGVGQALWEQCSYDAETGQLLSGSFMDYANAARRHAAELCDRIERDAGAEQSARVRAGGEGGTTPALGVVGETRWWMRWRLLA